MNNRDIGLVKINRKHWHNMDRLAKIVQAFYKTKASRKARWLKAYSRYKKRLNKKVSLYGK